MASQKDRRVLPPGVEDEVVFGIMWIRVGVLKSIRQSTFKHKVYIQFWGESEPVILEPEGSKALQQYDIKCPITIFQNYLRDMKKNFRVEVENLGIADVNLSAYLKPKYIQCKAPFNPMKGVFDVIGRTGKKVGSLELQMSAHFSPEIALRELQVQEQKQLQGPSKKIPLENVQIKGKPCPAQKMKGCKCIGMCKCKIDKINALDVLAVEKPDIFMQFYEESKDKNLIKNVKPAVSLKDDRIPNSLRVEPTTATFDANKYLQHDSVPAKNEQAFPTVQKILTYSNLRLKKQEQLKQSPKQNRIKQQPPILNQIIPRLQIESGETTPVNTLNQMNQFISQTIMKEEKPIQTSKKDKKVQIVQKNQRNESVVNKNMKIDPIIPVSQYDVKAEASISEIDKVHQLDQSDDIEAHHDILSRVVNLNQQLEKQRKRSPNKFPLKEVIQPKAVQSWTKPAFVHLVTAPQLISNQQKKRSNLLMNMVIQIPTATVKFIKSSKFVVSYLPYGQKEMIMVGPNIPLSLMIMFPVGQAQISKMNKIPFILQFWTNRDRQHLLGIIKLPLTKIYKGFMLEGRLNQMAVKTSILPTVIEKGVGMITTVTDKPVGQCYLSAYIGTTAQIQTFLNSHKNQVGPQPNLQIEKEQEEHKQDQKKKRQLQMREKGTIDDFTNLLTLIDSFSKPNAARQLLNFMNLKRADNIQFMNFIDRLGFKGANIFHLLENGQTFQCIELANSFEDYKKTKQEINNRLNLCLKDIPIKMLTVYVEKIKQKSIFGVISKQTLIEVIGNQIKDVTDYLGDAIETDSFVEWLRGQGRLSLKSIQLVGADSIKDVISNIFMRECKDVIHKMDQLLKAEQGSNQVSVSKLRMYFPKEGGRLFSIWFWLLLNNLIYSSFDEIISDIKVVNTSLLYNWIALRNRQLKEVENLKKQKQQIENIPKQDNKQIKEPLHRDDSLKKTDPIVQQQHENKEVIPLKQSQVKQNSLHQNQPLPQQKPKQQQQESNIIQHKFIISIQQLHLQQDFTGQCTIFYRFPFEEDQISSRHFQLQHDKHKYRLNSQGIHKFTINEPIHQYFGESTLNVRVVVAGDGQLCGDLHSDQLVVKGSQYRVVPLFSVTQEGIAGKIKLKVEYSNKKSNQLALGRQTVRDVFLPKNGYLNFELMTSVDQVKIRQQFNIKQQFYLLLSIDPFGQNLGLAPHYPPFNSKLQSDFSSPLVIVGSYKIALTPQIVQHLRGGSCTARLLMVYYAKQKGNYDRKQAVIASFKTPLISVIRQQGLKGDYAFKNKLGMFVSLAQCSIKYEKQARGQLELLHNNFARESYWIVIRFMEIINFEGELGWVRFEVARKGKRISTEKTLVRDEGFMNLEGSCLLLQMGEEDFASTKLLPISMNTAGQHFGIDINLRPIAKTLSKSKWAVDSHYFIVIDDQSRSRKIRVGAKIYAFRGQADLGHFVQAISKNQIQTKAEFSQRQDDYPELIEGLKKQLKLSSKALEQAMGLIVDRRKKQKLPLSFFSSKIYPNLDLTPIIGSSISDVNLLAEQMPSQVDKLYLIDNLEQLGIKLINLRPELLDRYSFSKLNEKRLDQNVEYLGLHSEIDLLVLMRKIRIEEAKNVEQSFRQKLEDGPKTVRISIIRGYNFHLLYNGIKPNARVRIPDIGLQTEVIERSSEPIFNEHMSLSVPKGELRKIRIEVYHEGSQQDEGILIGEATLSITESILSNDIPHTKIYRAVVNSLMSTKMQAALDVKVEVLLGTQGIPIEPRNILDEQSSIGDSRIEEVMDRVNNPNIYKRNAAAFFESSEEDD